MSADLRGVTFIDCHGLATLYQEQRTLRADGGDPRVLAASPRYVRVCRLAGYYSLEPAAGGPDSAAAPRLEVDVRATD